MKAIITVVGKDRTGIVAGVSSKIAELGLNIDDISQTVLDEFFTMMAVVSSEEKKDFTEFQRQEKLKYLTEFACLKTAQTNQITNTQMMK